MKRLSLVLICLFVISSTLYAGPRLSGRKAVSTAGTAERLHTVSNFCSTLIVTAFEDNTDIVVVGTSSVDATQASRTGTVLFPGQTEYLTSPSGRLDVHHTWIDSEVNSEGASWNCLN